MLPGAGPGLRPTGPGKDAAAIRDGSPGAVLLLNADPVRTYPAGDAWAKTLAGTFVVSFAMFDDESTRHANLVFPAESHAEKEGVVTHPEGRLQRLRPNVPTPEGLRPGWRALAEISTALGDDPGFESAEDVFQALSEEVPFYGETAYEEIGGRGLRWQERDPGESWIPERSGAPGGTAYGADSAITRSASEGGDAPAYAPTAAPPVATGDGDQGSGLVLGTYRDLWASEVTVRNPALRFLMPEQRLELSAKDAKQLELGNGDPVTVSVNGSSVEARVAIRERMRPGAAFLIEGTSEQNGNVLANGKPQAVRVEKR
jgi:NADH-quinone oxidoreductase subunit G